MATSGTLHGNNVDGSEGSYFNWQLVFQTVEGNYSQINWQVGWRFSTVSCRGLRKGRAIVHGTWVYNDQDGGDGVHNFGSGHNHKPALQTASGTINLAHDASGNLSFNAFVEMTGWDGGPNLYSAGSTSWSLPQIARFSGPPSLPIISEITSTSVLVTFTDGTGGAPIDSREIGYGTDPVIQTTIVSSDGSTLIEGLTPGTTYYFWARTHNVAGFSPWSARATAVTFRVPDAPSTPVISDVTPTTVVVNWLPNGDGGTIITDYQLGYGIDSVTPDITISAMYPKTVIDLDPGIKYYFWVRAQNSVGWGPWSESANVTTIAGARVKVGATWKLGVAYVRHDGEWKLARPWVRELGVWKESI